MKQEVYKGSQKSDDCAITRAQVVLLLDEHMKSLDQSERSVVEQGRAFLRSVSERKDQDSDDGILMLFTQQGHNKSKPVEEKCWLIFDGRKWGDKIDNLVSNGSVTLHGRSVQVVSNEHPTFKLAAREGLLPNRRIAAFGITLEGTL